MTAATRSRSRHWPRRYPPLLGAYSASKAGVEALADALRTELASTGARVGVAYFAELDTDMTSRGFGTEAAARLQFGRRRVRAARVRDRRDRTRRRPSRPARRRPPGWVAPLLQVRMPAQQVIDAFLTRLAAAT
jgi:NAD(P)-dependent dehydrogenase (short-subunit alcohol dehydrogenase family)